MQKQIERVHITEEMWIALERDTMDQELFMQILEHTNTCIWCAQRMGDVLGQGSGESQENLILPPAYLEDQILERARHLDVQAAVAVKQTSKKLQLFFYSLKVGMAVAFSILILSVTANVRELGMARQEQQMEEYQENGQFSPEEKAPKEDFVLGVMNRAADGMASQMNEFANLLLNGGKKE